MPTASKKCLRYLVALACLANVGNLWVSHQRGFQLYCWIFNAVVWGALAFLDSGGFFDSREKSRD